MCRPSFSLGNEGEVRGQRALALTRRSPLNAVAPKVTLRYLTTLTPFPASLRTPPATYLQLNRFAPLTALFFALMPSGLSASALARWVIPWLHSTILPTVDIYILGTLDHTTLSINLHNYLTNTPANSLMHRGFHRAPYCSQAIFATHGFFSYTSWSSAHGACLGTSCFAIG